MRRVDATPTAAAPRETGPFLRLSTRRGELVLGRRTALMGVVNVTPDSFYAASRVADPASAVERALAHVDAGADIVDIGGESTRPGAAPTSLDEEIRRVVPVVEALRSRTDVLLSVDTRRSAVARRALEAGCDLVNDVTAMADPEMAPTVGAFGAGVVLMHMKGTPETMQRDPRYDDVVAEVRAFLAAAIERAVAAGVPRDAIVVDPGIGFGKTVRHNLELVNRLGELAALGRPVLVGTSRKTFLGRLVDAPPEGRLFATAASVAAAILRGAHIVRVHDVAAMRDVVRVADAIRNEDEG